MSESDPITDRLRANMTFADPIAQHAAIARSRGHAAGPPDPEPEDDDDDA